MFVEALKNIPCCWQKKCCGVCCSLTVGMKVTCVLYVIWTLVSLYGVANIKPEEPQHAIAFIG